MRVTVACVGTALGVSPHYSNPKQEVCQLTMVREGLFVFPGICKLLYNGNLGQMPLHAWCAQGDQRLLGKSDLIPVRLWLLPMYPKTCLNAMPLTTRSVHYDYI